MWWVVAGPILKIFICPNLHSRGEPSLVLRGAKIPSGRSSWSPLHCSLCTLTSMLELTTGYSHFLVKELKLFHIFTQNTNSNIDPVQKYWKKAATNIFTCFGEQRSRCQRQMEEFEIILNFFLRNCSSLSLIQYLILFGEQKSRLYPKFEFAIALICFKSVFQFHGWKGWSTTRSGDDKAVELDWFWLANKISL